MTIELRAQVLITAFCPLSLRAFTFFINLTSTNGPFFVDLPKLTSSVLALIWSLDSRLLNDHIVATFVLSGLDTAGGLTPGGLGARETYPYSSLTTTMGVVTW